MSRREKRGQGKREERVCSKRKRKRAKDRRIAGIGGISQKPFQLPHTPISISAVSIPLIPNVHFMLCLLSLTGKLVLKHVYLLPHAFFSFPNLVGNRLLVLEHIYVTFHALSSFPHLKTSFEAYICYILCFVCFPYSKTSFEACVSLILSLT